MQSRARNGALALAAGRRRGVVRHDVLARGGRCVRVLLVAGTLYHAIREIVLGRRLGPAGTGRDGLG